MQNVQRLDCFAFCSFVVTVSVSNVVIGWPFMFVTCFGMPLPQVVHNLTQSFKLCSWPWETSGQASGRVALDLQRVIPFKPESIHKQVGTIAVTE